MFQKEWPILVVDDDADVLAVSKLAMRDFKVNGLSVTLHTASSKAEAIDGGAAPSVVSDQDLRDAGHARGFWRQ